MNNTLKLFCFTFLLLLIAACDKDGFKPDYLGGKATALKNGQDWIGQGRGIVNTMGIGIDMYFDIFDDLGQRRQNIAFSKIPRELGVYPVFNTSGQSQDSTPGCSFYTLSLDGDVLEDTYVVVESKDESIVTVLNYSESERLLSGEFKVKLHIDPNRPKINPNNPDTIVFEMGEFEVWIEE